MLAIRILTWSNLFCTFKVILHDVHCQGVERNFSQCKHRGWRRTGCNHYEDVGVKCHAPQLQGHPVINTARIDLFDTTKLLSKSRCHVTTVTMFLPPIPGRPENGLGSKACMCVIFSYLYRRSHRKFLAQKRCLQERGIKGGYVDTVTLLFCMLRCVKRTAICTMLSGMWV